MRTIQCQGAKVSSGLLILSGRRLLLLKRAPHTGNGGTWGLPGGRLDNQEAAYAAAFREATEEMSSVPPHGLVGELAIQRAHRRYEIFAGRTPKKTQRIWVPKLNSEHVAHTWATQKWCRENRPRLHPILEVLLTDSDGRQWLKAMFEGLTIDEE